MKNRYLTGLLTLIAFGPSLFGAEVQLGKLPPGWVIRTNFEKYPQLKGMKNLWTIGSAELDPKDPLNFIVSPSGNQWVNADHRTPDADTRQNAGHSGTDMQTIEKYGDVHVEFEVMVPDRGNSGFYLCGEYEVQLWASYGKQVEANQEFGTITATHDPYVRAEKPNGKWNHFIIDFRAPRFNEKGEKIANANVIRMTLNGQLIHENIEIPAPTPVGLTGKEVAEGPILLQGFTGQVAFRNMKIERR